jgi:hypothetical protein
VTTRCSAIRSTVTTYSPRPEVVRSRPARLCICLVLAAALFGSIGGAPASTRSAPAHGASGEGVPACLKAEGVRVPEGRYENRIVGRRARRYPIVGVRYAAGDTVVIWERSSPTLVRRVYMEWSGVHGRGAPTPSLRRRAIQLAVYQTAHPHRAFLSVTFANGTRREARTLEKTCLHSRPRRPGSSHYLP